MTQKKDSPHLLANKIRGEIYLAFAEHDIWVPKKVLDKIISTFSNLKIKSKLIYIKELTMVLHFLKEILMIIKLHTNIGKN